MQAAPTAAKGSAAERRAGSSITAAPQAPVRPMPENLAGGMTSPDALVERALRRPTVMAAAPAGRTHERPSSLSATPFGSSIKGRHTLNYEAISGSGTGPGNPAPMPPFLPTTVLTHHRRGGSHLDERPAAHGDDGKRPRS